MLAREAPSSSIGAAQGLELWFQPIYDIHNGSVRSNEVLLRWRDTSGSLHLPHQFMAELTRSQAPGWLDRLVIQQSVATLVTHPRLTLSINLSEQVFKDSGLVDYIHGQLIRWQIRPAQLQFELCERHLAENFQDAIAFIQDLRSIGCSVVLDGFANEYLTFLEWERLNVNAIKLENHLIQEANHNLQQAHLARSILDTSLLFEQPAVAKSIDRSSALHRFRFDSAQGYHFKPPSHRPWLVNKVNLLGVSIDDISQADLLEQLTAGVVFTPTVDHLMAVRKDQAFAQVYNAADYKVCDSQSLGVASKFLGSPLKNRSSASDLFPAFYTHHQNNPEITIFLLGGTGHEAVQAQTRINQKVGRAMVVDAYSPLRGFEHDERECQAIVERINDSGATVLTIGVGSPVQERWVHRYQTHLSHVNIIFAIEAIIASEAGTQTRSPQIMNNWGLQWISQLTRKPKRF